MVAAFDYCLHGKGGAAPSIDTAMHGLVDAAHVDHLHPDSGIALATAADGEALTSECFGDRVVWVPWRRPGFQLGLDIAAIQRRQPAGDRRDPRRPRHHRLGRRPRRVRGAARSRSSGPPSGSSPSAAEPSRSVPSSPATRRCPRPSAAPGPPRSLPVDPRPGLDRPAAGRPLHRHRRRARLPRRARAPAGSPRWAPRAPTTSCAPRSGRWCSTCRRRAPLERGRRPAAGAARGLPRGLRGLLRAPRRRRTARRCAAPTRPSCWCPASACSPSARTSRPPGWPASSTSTPST